MIDVLSKEQEEQLLVYRDKWMAIGLNCEPANQSEAEDGVRWAYDLAGLKKPRTIIWAESPFGCLEEYRKITKKSKSEVAEETAHFSFGNHDASWLGFYEFFREQCGLVKETDPLQGLTQVAKNSGWFLAYDTHCFMSDRPKHLYFNKENRCHNYHGKAIEFRDGFGVYVSNGVHMDPWMIDMEPQDMGKKRILGITNVEQRREVIRRIGVERFIEIVGAKVLDKRDDYELLKISLGEGLEDCRYLKMKNPSIEVYHVEGVDEQCKTVQEAINWRATGDRKKLWNPAVLT